VDEQRSRGGARAAAPSGSSGAASTEAPSASSGAAAGRARPVTGAVTLKQVAAEAEVSLATASRVLHRSGGREVRGELAERVQAAAGRLGYVSNPHAQALARARSSTVGLIVHEVTDPYFAAIAAGAMHAAHAEGVMVMMAATFRDPELELDYLGRLRAQGARGVLLAGSGSTDPRVSARLAEAVDAFTRDGGRVAAIGARPDTAVDTVVPANADGARAALAHLQGLGHRRIGVVSGPETLRTVRERLDGLGLGAGPGTGQGAAPAAPGTAPGLQIEGADFTREGGRAAARRLLAADEAEPVTAIIALNDLMAAGVLAAARETGRAVPDELSVVGFDDLPFAADLEPALTTVRLPLRAMGERAMELLLSEPEDAPRAAAVPTGLVVRASTAAVPRPAPRRSTRD
jgi:LacI family transcriptional regulator